jgi:WD40 repeat protein/tetratricopeptide (TPR) repeat protein/predicted Ser/Thr protein kinase
MSAPGSPGDNLPPTLSEIAGLTPLGLVALLREEQRRCWEVGERRALEELLARHPDLRSHPEFVLDLLFSEFILREEAGDRPILDEFALRFPDCGGGLRRLVEAHWALQGGRELPTADSQADEEPIPPPALLGEGVAAPPTSVMPPTVYDGVPHPEQVPSISVPGYQVLRLLGRGAMGVVYLARQIQADRQVALKMVLYGEYADVEDRERFRREARAVARLQHPNIVQVYEVSEHNGMPYFSMEYCAGGNLGEKLNGAPMPPLDAATLVETLAATMHAAHHAAILHRDLKPGNILLNSDGQPKISDFGLAKRLDQAGSTQSGVIKGTPSYMAPEQVSGRSEELTAAVDVYALGAILYECLTGRPPFCAPTTLETLQQVREKEPASVRQVQPNVPRDLETICHKCLTKDPRKRYESAAALSADLGRFRSGDPVLARRTGWLERVVKWCLRRPAVAVLLALVILFATTGVVGIVMENAEAVFQRDLAREAARKAADAARNAEEAANRAEREAQNARQQAKEAEQARDEVRHRAYLAEVGRADASWQAGDDEAARALLDEVKYEPRGWEYHHLRRRMDGTPLLLCGHTRGVRAVSWSPDGTRVASASQDRTIRIWNVRTGAPVCTLHGHTDTVHAVCWSPDANKLASAGDFSVRVWDGESGKELVVLNGHVRPVTSVSWSPDGTRLASGSQDQTIRIWDLGGKRGPRALHGHTDDVTCICWSPDGARLASASADKTVRTWDVANAKELVRCSGHGGPVAAVSWSPDGARLASGGQDQRVRVWEADTAHELLSHHHHDADITSVTWSPDGAKLAIASVDQTISVWHVRTRTELMRHRGHTGKATGVAWSPDGLRLASASTDGTVRVWQARSSLDHLPLRGHGGVLTSLSWSPDGARLATASEDGTVRTWDGRTGAELVRMQGCAGRMSSVAWSPDGGRLVGGSMDHWVRTWDAQSGRLLVAFSAHRGGVRAVSWSPQGDRLATASDDRTVAIWAAATGVLLHRLPEQDGAALAVSWDRDGLRLASASADATVRTWDAEEGVPLRVLRGHRHAVTAVVWSPDGDHLASAAGDYSVRIWAASGKEGPLLMQGHAAPILALSWSPDGSRLAGSSVDRAVHIWDARTGSEALTLHGPVAGAPPVAWSPDGRRLATAWADNVVRVWDGRQGPRTLTLRGHTEQVISVAWSPDGTKLLTRDELDRRLMWSPESGLPQPGDDLPDGRVTQELSPTGDMVALPQLPLPLVRVYPLRRPEGGPDFWDEDMQQRRELTPDWHADEAREAQKAGDDFAESFHRFRLARLRPGDRRNWEGLESLGQRRKEIDDAVRICDRLLQGDPLLAPVYLQRARLRRAVGELAPAEQDERRGRELAAKSRGAWPEFAAGEAAAAADAVEAGDWTRARNHLELAALWQADEPERLGQLALLLAASADRDAYRLTCQRLVKFVDGKGTTEMQQRYLLSTTLGFGLGRMLSLARGCGPAAARVLSDEAKRHHTAVVLRAAVLLPESGVPWKDQKRLARELVAEAPEDGAAHELLGAILYRAGETAKALEELDKAVSRQGHASAVTRLFLALVHQRLGHVEEANWYASKTEGGPGWEEALVRDLLRQELGGMWSPGEKR